MGPVKLSTRSNQEIVHRCRGDAGWLRALVACLAVCGAAWGLAGCAAHGGAKGKSAVPTAPAAASTRQPEIATIPCPGKTPPAPALRTPALRSAIAAYDAGRFADALPDLRSAQADGSADGAVLYRLAYCYESVLKDKALAQSTYESCRQSLEARISSSDASLEDHFYLVNVLLALNRDAEGKTAAIRAVDAIEKCTVLVGTDGTSAFRVGKLYGDAGRVDGQSPWYRRALAQFDSETNPPAAYVERAATQLAASDPDRGEWSSAVAALEKLRSLRPQDPSLAFQLTLALIQSGDFDGARKSLDALRPMSGARVDDLVYIEGMIAKGRRMAKAGHPIPGKEADGRTFGSLTQEELESRMKEAAATGEMILSAKPEEGSFVIEERGPQKTRVMLPGPELLGRIDAAQGRLLALSLEVVRRGLPLQEIAFTSGISPLVVQDWRGQWIMMHREPEAPPTAPSGS